MEIVWDDEAGAVVRPAFEPALAYHIGLVPSWCRRLYIGYDAHHTGDSALYVNGHPEYRWARITVCPAVLQYTDAHREEQLVHELFHLPLEPLNVAATDLRGFADGKLNEFLREHWRRAWEGAVCDLTDAYLRVRRLHPPVAQA